ncbi:MAG: DUF4435 domain-containing protein [Pseudomonadota bacterium]
MLRWPVEAGRAIARLFSPLQDIDIFIEDQGDEVFYSHLFSVASSPPQRICRVVALGGRGEVEAACRTYAGARKALFLIDGDLAWVRGDPAPNIDRLYRLQCYCIENAIIIQRAVEALVSEDCICAGQDAEQRLQFNDWKREVDGLVDLFVRYAVLNALAPEIPTVHRIPIGNLLVAGQPPSLCPTKLSAAIAVAETEIVGQVGTAQALEEIGRVEGRVSLLSERLAIVSGKDFLLPLLLFRVKGVIGMPIRKDVMRFRLAKQCQREDLGELIAALSAAA